MNKERKYEFTGECKINEAGVELRRIRCTKHTGLLGCIIPGMLGGWIEKEENLSGNAWVTGNAEVYGNAEVCDNVLIFDRTRVCDNVRIGGDANVSGAAKIYGNMQITGTLNISGAAKIYVKGDEGVETADDTGNSRPTDYDMELRRFCVEKAVQLSNAGRGDVSLLAMDIERYIRHGKCKFL